MLRDLHDQYFAVNDIDSEKKVPALLTLIGGKTYGLLRNLTAPDKPSTKTYAVITELLQKHLSPKPLVIAERYRFHKRNQRQDESVNDYVAELRKLSEHCAFRDLNDALRDRFVCGLKEDSIQKKLLSVADLTLAKALETAVAMEMAGKDAIELQRKQGEATVHKINKGRGRTSYNAQQQKAPAMPPKKRCFRCRRKGHDPNECRFKDEICHKCKKKGHIARACPLNFRKNGVKSLEDDYDEEDIAKLSVDCNTVQKGRNSDVIWIDLKIDGHCTKMELDTGSAVSVMSNEDFKSMFKDRKLSKTSLILRTYSGEKINPLGVISVHVTYKEQEADLDLYVVKTKGPALLGRDWLRNIRLDWPGIKTLSSGENYKHKLNQLLIKHSALFKPEIGSLKQIKAMLKLKEDASPKFCKARPVPYSLKPKIEAELQKLEEQGILSRVEVSDWATPIVPVVKKDGSVRICGDFKVTVNPALQIDQYPLPRIEDIFANLAGGEKFSKIDLRQAYLHMNLEEISKPLLTINTHKGLYRYNRMLYGVASAPAIWQRAIEQVLQGLPGVQCILDDMVITGRNDKEHIENLAKVLQRLEDFNLRVNKEKCEFFADRVAYCGHEIDKSGIWKSRDKIDAVIKTQAPGNVTQLRSFLGLINYYNRFLPNLASEMKPLHELLEKGKPWAWKTRQQEAFEKAKKLITSEPVLAHYDPQKEIRLACDASPYGLGAVLSHVFDDKTERPIAFNSKSLSKAEQNYAQIDKEALAIYWAVKKFYPYLFSRNFTLVTDHQPLTSIFNPSKSLPVTSASRLQRYAMFLSGFTYSIIYKNTKQHTNADALSRLPLKCENNKDFDAVDVFHTTQIETLPMTSETVANATRRDTVLSQVLLRVQGCWTEGENDKSLSSFYNRRHELSLHQNCLMWGIRVIIPSTLKKQVLELLHSSHPGVVKMKSLARSYVWWSGIDSDIERLAKECAGCQKQQNNPGKVYVHPWEWPSAPWQRVHIDFAGPFLDQNFFILVDAHSKWPEVIPMKRITTARTIEVLRTIFSRNGIPEQIVSDNGPQFTSAEFGQFMKNNAIRHYKSAPYHPATNGLAERFVQTFKRSIRSMKHDSMSLNKKIANFLLQYRNTPHTTTNESPAKLFVGRQLRSRLDLIRPNIQGKVDRAKMNSAFRKKGKPAPSFKPGDHVIVRDYRGNKWINGTIESLLGPLNCTVKTDFGSLWKRHVDQIRKTECRNKTEFSETRYDERVPVTPCTISVPCNDTVSTGIDHNNVSESVSADIESESTDHNAEIKRYPTCERKAPKRLIEKM
ncbi:hypothetical protein FSP39_024809 [Pinctada imbricata]|uniref:Endonuclease n=1 Tax=Pinctada imbricata TaxID=66713 RepID=A0AA88XHA8_PINIB|nr:hypothetical protein FSP39_024809 [Pinctada imbricata]